MKRTNQMSLTKEKEEDLINFLKNNGLISDDDEDIKKRKSVIDRLQLLLDQWVCGYFKEKNIVLSSDVSSHCAKLYASGSFALGCITKNSDLDLVCILSNYLTREILFNEFKQFLKSQLGVTHVQTIDQTTCPLMKMNVDGIEVDVSVAMLHCEVIPSNCVIEDEMMEKMDDISVRSYMGLKTAKTFLELIPNKEMFNIFINAIKFWAKRKGIYSNSIGYLCGVSCTVMCVYICRTYAGLDLFETVKTFFEVFSQWKWPEPVLLTGLYEGSSNHKSWNCYVDSDHVMPIITPNHPHKNCAYNVTLANRKIIANQFRKAHKMINDIEMNKATWENLFEDVNFCKNYNLFLVVCATSDNFDDQFLWQGLVESKLKFLVMDLDKLPAISILQVNPKSYRYRNNFDEYLTKWLIGLEVNCPANSVLNLQPEIKRFRHFVIDRVKQSDWFKESMMIYIDSLSKKNADPEDYLPNSLKHFQPVKNN